MTGRNCRPRYSATQNCCLRIEPQLSHRGAAMALRTRLLKDCSHVSLELDSGGGALSTSESTSKTKKNEICACQKPHYLATTSDPEHGFAWCEGLCTSVPIF